MFKTIRAALDHRTYEEREAPAAEKRWRKHNVEAHAAGCKCGRTATHVRRLPHVIGSVPCEIWTCEEHINVNAWNGVEGGWVPAEDAPGFDSPGMAPWAGWVTRA